MALISFAFRLIRLPLDLLFFTFDFGRVLVWPAAVVMRKVLRMPPRTDDPMHRGGDVFATGRQDCPRAWKYGSRGAFRLICPFMRQTEDREPICTFHGDDPQETHWPSLRRRVALAACLLLIWGGIGRASAMAWQRLPFVQRWRAPAKIAEAPPEHQSLVTSDGVPPPSRPHRPWPKVQVPAPTRQASRQDSAGPSPGPSASSQTNDTLPADTSEPKAIRKAEEFVQSGDVYFAQERYMEALIEYKNAIQRDASNARARLGAGLSYLRMNRRDRDARYMLEKALGLDPTLAEAHAELCRLALAERSMKRATEHGRKLKELRPHDAETSLLLSACLDASGDTDAALKEIDAAMGSAEATADTFWAAGDLYLKQDEHSRAETVYRRALELEPDGKAARVGLATSLRRQGQLDAAKQELDPLLQQTPPHAAACVELAEIQVAQRQVAAAIRTLEELAEREPKRYDSRARLADLFIKTRRLDAGMTVVEKTLKESPRHVQSRLVLAHAYTNRGFHTKAVEQCDRILAVDPRNVPAQIVKGRVHMAKRQHGHAVKVLARALETAPEHSTARLLLGDTFLAMSQLDQAKECFETVAQQYPKSPLPHMRLGLTQIRKGLPEAAIVHYEEARRRQPNSPIILNNIASLLLDLGTDPDRAYKLASDVRKRFPAFGMGADTYGWACYQRGEYQKAVESLLFASRRLPRSPGVRYHCGMAFYRTGELGKAKQELEAALKLAPSFPGAAEAKATLAKIGK